MTKLGYFRFMLLLLFAAMASVFSAIPAAQAATCASAASQGTSGPADWQSYCWIDMTSYNAAQVFGAGQPFSITLSDGSTLTFTLSATTPNGGTLVAVGVPSWTGSAFGNNAFLAIPGKPVLYTGTAGTTVNLTFNNIKITPPNGVVSTGQYSFVVGDGESTNSGESLSYTTNGGNWTVVDQVANGAGTVYPPSIGIGTQTYQNTGVGSPTGAWVVASQSPTTVTAQLVAGGLQGIIFAIQYSTVTVKKTISGSRASPADQFTYGIYGTVSGTAISAATSSGAGLSGFASAVASMSSSVLGTIKETMAAGSVSNINQYTPSLTCTNATAGSPTVMPTNVSGTSYNLGNTAYGDAITCTFTNTPKPATVSLQKITTGAIGGPFTFTATNLASNPAAITTTVPGTAAPSSPAPINVTAYNTAVTITETPAANFSATAASCTDANSAITGNPASFGTLAGNVLTIPAANVLAGAQITCTLTNGVNTATAATVAVQKITQGTSGGPFTFTSTNLSLTPAPITTSATATAFPTTLSPIPATAVGTAVTVTEGANANFTTNSASCTDANAAASGNPAGSFGTLAGQVLTIPATNIRAKAQITCVFTNTAIASTPTVAVQKITTTLTGGPFSFTATNLTGTLSNITTTTAGVAAPASPTPVTVTNVASNVTITESANANFNPQAASCTDTNAALSGNSGTFGTLAGNVLTVPSANLKLNAKIVCTFTNAPKPATLALQKITVGAFGGPFIFTATNLAANPASITTIVAGTAAPASPTPINANALSTAVTITEAANASFNTTSATCSDANASFTGNPASFGSLSGNVLTIPAANVLPAAQINCTITNTAKPATVAVQKITTGSYGGPFTFAVSNLAAAPASITTAAPGTPTPATPTPSAVTTLNSQVLISEGTNPAWSFTTASCTDANSAVTGNPASFGTLSGRLITIPAANVLPAAQITCTFTNAAIPATVAIQKTTNSVAGGPFTFAATNLSAAPAAITTAAAGTPTPASPTGIAVSAMNAQVQLTEANAAFTLTTASCTDSNAANSGNSGTFGTLVGNTLTIPAANIVSSATIICAFTNTPIPATVKVQKITSGAAGGPFSFAATNLASSPAAITTTAAATPTPASPSAIQVTTLGSAVTLTESYTINFATTLAACTDANSAVTGNIGSFGTLAGNVLTIAAANVKPASQISCTFTNTANAPTISLQKALSSARNAGADQFKLTATGTGAPAAVNTTGTGSTITSAPLSFTATAGQAYTLNESMTAGSTSLITAYAKTVACANTNPQGTNVSSLNTVPIAFTAQAGDAISCTITNNGTATPQLAVTKTYSPAGPFSAGQTVTYSYAVTNTGNITMYNVQVADMHGSPATLVSLGAGGITNETLTTPGPLGAGASSDATANDGIWSVLAPGATVTFTWAHVVTQAEMDHG